MRRPTRKLALRRHFELSDEARFFKTWVERPLTTGAVSPSSPALARAMAGYVNPNDTGPVIELGPGTGPMTEALVRRGIEPSRLILVEYDADFADRLARRYPTARVIQGDAYALTRLVAPLLEEPAAAVVSSLPLLTKPEVKRLALLNSAFDLMAEGRPFIQFTYAVVSPIPKKFGKTALPFTAEASPPIWLNLPPARVWVYRRLPRAKRMQAAWAATSESHRFL